MNREELLSSPSSLAWIDGFNSGALALSPSRQLLAIANMDDGVDWYSIKDREYLSSTTYEKPGDYKYIAGIDFIDERTVVAGNSGGQLMFATHGRATAPPRVILNKKLGAEGRH